MKKTLLSLLIILLCCQMKAQCWKTAATGYNHTVAVKTDGTLWAWGSNSQGQLGNNITTNKNIPTQMQTADDWKTVAAGWGHTVALKTDGSLWAWGYGQMGQIGNGSFTTNLINPPQQIGIEKNWQTIVAGNGHTVALKTDGTLWAWGNNFSGQVGNGYTFDENTPAQIGTDNDWQTIAAGELYTVALKKDGSLWAWGSNTYGTLGDGTTTRRTAPKQIGTATDWKTITAGSNHTIAIKADGSLWAWGNNTYGALGDGTTTNKIVPTQIGTSTDWKTVTAGVNYSIAIKTDGTLWAWGFNSDGELGNGTKVNSLVPVQIGIENNWQLIDGGSIHTVAMKTDGSLLTWGSNSLGQLGDATSTDKNAPTLLNCPVSTIIKTKQININCAGDKTGSAAVTSISGATAPYTYLWSNGATTPSISGLTAATYSCTITDATSSIFTIKLVITQPTPVAFTATTTSAVCNDDNNGSISINATGGIEPYQYAISPDFIYQPSNVFSGLSSGTYTVSLKDSNGCIAPTSNAVTVTANNTPPPTVTKTSQTFSSGATVSNLQATGLDIQWYDTIGAGGFLSTAQPLQSGKYYATQIINGCQSSKTAVDVIIIPIIPKNGLLAYYPFDQNANDISGNGYNGIVAGAVLTTDRYGNANSAYSFDGVSSYIDATIATIPQNNSPRTISGWFKTNSPNFAENNYSTIFNYGNLSTTQRFALSIYSKGYLDFITASDFSNNDLGVQNNYLDNTWYFFTITYDGTKVSLFVNGNYIDGKNITLNTINKTFRIGKRITGDTYNEYFKGSIDDIGIWNRVLTANEITGLYNSKNNLYTLIPDVNFEKKLIALGVDSGATDGKVLTNSINKLTSLDVSTSSITDLTGIQDFSALTNLNCDSNKLTTLDVSKNLNLNKIDCNYNQIVTLDVSNNLNLKSLGSAINKLTTLDVTKNITLTELNCENNQLTALDISKNASLGRLRCPNNQLKTLDVSFNVSLDTLVCNTNKLSRLDISKNIVLKQLNCSSNQLISLNLKNGSNINFVNSKLSFGNNPNLSCIQVDDVAYANANWANKKDATANFNTDCATANLYTYIPDINFEQKLIHYGIEDGKPDGKVLTAKIKTLENLNVYNSSITDLTGIEDFVSLKVLNCSQNSLTALNVSKNTLLKTLACNNNKLETLDVSNNIALDSLSTYTNRLTALDVKTNKALKKLDCGSNQITTLDVSNNTSLLFLGCNTSLLTTLDVSRNTALNLLDCRENKLTDLDVSKITTLTELYCQSNQLTNLDVSKNKALEFLNCSKNQLTTLDVSLNTALVGLYSNSNQLKNLNLKNGNNVKFEYLNFTNNPNLSCIQVDDINYSNTNWTDKKDVTANYNLDCSQYTLIPDSKFEQKLIDLGIDTDGLNGKISVSNIVNITNLDLSNSSISNLSGIEQFTSLETLICKGNSLSTITVSNNTALKYLDCSNNPLTTLDVSKNIKLTELHCDGIVSITTKGDNMKNSNVAQLTVLDLSNNLFLTKLSCSNNQLVNLDLSKNTLLTDLNCSNNQLTNLNLNNSNNTNMLNVSFKNNSSLSCIKVDNPVYSNTNWSKAKDITATYSSTCSKLGIEDSVFNKIVISPNPTKGELHINNVVLEKATVYDALGKLLKTATFTSGTKDNTMYLEGLPSGIYYIYLEGEGANTAKKIIIE